MATMQDIETKTKIYGTTRRVLADRVQALNDGIEKLRRQAMPGIKRAIEQAAEEQEILRRSIEASPELFASPRTVVINGIRVGLVKGKGKIEWNDDAQVVKLIRKNFPEQFDILVKTTEKPLKKSLAQLSVADLKRIGVTVEEAGDQVVIQSTDTDIDKLVKALLKDETDETAEEAA